MKSFLETQNTDTAKTRLLATCRHLLDITIAYRAYQQPAYSWHGDNRGRQEAIRGSDIEKIDWGKKLEIFHSIRHLQQNT